MEFSNESLNKTIRELVVLSNSDILAIRAEQNSPAPKGVAPYATVRISLLPQAGWAEVILANNPVTDIDEQICKFMRCRASVNYFKKSVDYSDPQVGTYSAIDEATRFATYLEGTNAYQKMDADGLGLETVSEVRNITALQNAQWEERAQLDIDFNIVSSRQDLVCEIKSILVSGEYQEHGNIYPVSILIDENSG